MEEQGKERDDYWDIDDFGMALSCLVAQTAEKIDEKRRVGSCVLSEDGQVLSFGYNHMPDKSDDYNWEDKHNYVFHAEMDALKQTTKSEIWTHRASLYTTLHPCSMCARYIVLMGLQRVVFYSDWKSGKFKTKEARKILADSKFKQYPKEVGSGSVTWPAKLNFNHLKSKSTCYCHGPSASSQFTDDDKFFLRVAMMASKMSQDPSTQVGACLGRVTDHDKQERRIGGIGYNTMPRSGRLPWGKKTKYDYVCFAVRNAIMSRTVKNVQDYTLYTTHHPSCFCAQITVEVGIKKVVYISDKFSESQSADDKKKMIEDAKVIFSKHKISVKKFDIDHDPRSKDLDIDLDLDALEKGKPQNYEKT
jgi:dCMP deaminase